MSKIPLYALVVSVIGIISISLLFNGKSNTSFKETYNDIELVNRENDFNCGLSKVILSEVQLSVFNNSLKNYDLETRYNHASIWTISIVDINTNKLLFNLLLTPFGKLTFEYCGKYFDDPPLAKKILSFAKIDSVSTSQIDCNKLEIPEEK